MPGHVLRAVYVLIHNPAPTHFSNEEILLLEASTSPRSHGSSVVQPGVKPKEKGSRLPSQHCPWLPSDVLVRQLPPTEGGDLLRVTQMRVSPSSARAPSMASGYCLHSLGKAGGTHLLHPASPRATHLPLPPPRLKKCPQNTKGSFVQSPKGT